MINKEDFKLMEENYLSSLNASVKDEYYMTPKQAAAEVLGNIYTFLFQADEDKEARRTIYLELQKEFG